MEEDSASLGHYATGPGLKGRILMSTGLWRAGTGGKKGREMGKTVPQLSRDKPSFPGDVTSRGMKDKVREAQSCCKQISEHNVLVLVFWFSTHIGNFLGFPISLF